MMEATMWMMVGRTGTRMASGGMVGGMTSAGVMTIMAIGGGMVMLHLPFLIYILNKIRKFYLKIK